MRRGLHAAFALVAEGGRLGLLTWKHSECAIVVDFLRYPYPCPCPYPYPYPCPYPYPYPYPYQ